MMPLCAAVRADPAPSAEQSRLEDIAFRGGVGEAGRKGERLRHAMPKGSGVTGVFVTVSACVPLSLCVCVCVDTHSTQAYWR